MGQHRGMGAPSLTSSDALLNESFDYRERRRNTLMTAWRRIRTEAGCSLHSKKFDVARRTLAEVLVRRITDRPFFACEQNEQVVRGTTYSFGIRMRS
jgi:hypothetical protein